MSLNVKLQFFFNLSFFCIFILKSEAVVVATFLRTFTSHLYLREAADETVVSTGTVLCVQAVVEEAGVAGVHTVHTDVQLCCDAAPQVLAAAGELDSVKGQ